MTDTIDEDLLPDDLNPAVQKGKAVPLVRTPKQSKALAKAEEKQRLQADAVRLAQIVNLHIAGYSLADIAAQTGSTAEEIDRLLAADTARYVKNQPALRTYVRNWVSERYMKMIEANWDRASDANAADRLENQDRVMRMLQQMSRLHGAEAPTQAEVKVDAAPEAVEALVNRLASAQGLGYDADIFDVDPADIHEAVVVSENDTRVSGNAADQPQEGEPDDGF